MKPYEAATTKNPPKIRAIKSKHLNSPPAIKKPATAEKTTLVVNLNFESCKMSLTDNI